MRRLSLRLMSGVAVAAVVTQPGTPSGAAGAAPAAQTVVASSWRWPSLNGFTIRQSGGTVVSGVTDAQASDGKVAELTLTTRRPTPTYAAELISPKRYLYGTFHNRLRSADCSGQPNAGVVTGSFTYGNNGTDLDRDGLTDNSEIDVEVLCARPDILFLTIWTDYDPVSGRHSRVSRVIDLRAGKVLWTRYLTSFDGNGVALSGAENAPATVAAIPGFNSSAALYDYGISWSAGRVLFTVSDATTTRTLWDYRGPRNRIPHTPSWFLTNVWHTSDWAAPGRSNAVLPPTRPVKVIVDRTMVTTTA